MATPRYRVTERTYHEDKIYEADMEMDFEGIPAFYMDPINAEARKMKAKAPGTEMTFFQDLPNTVGEEQEMEAKVQRDIKAKAKANGEDPDIFS